MGGAAEIQAHVTVATPTPVAVEILTLDSDSVGTVSGKQSQQDFLMDWMWLQEKEGTTETTPAFSTFNLSNWKNQIAFRRDGQNCGIRFGLGGEEEFRFEHVSGDAK